MSFIKATISEKQNSDPISFIKELTAGLNSYLEYYSMIRFENISEFISQFDKHNFFPIRGAAGTGKNSFKDIIKNTFDENKNIFEYNCCEITELDDIFFTFYKFMLKHPQQKEIFKNPKSNFKPKSIDEQILYYLKRTNGSTILIFNNFDKLLDENGNFRATNVKSFFEFLSTIKDLKIIITSTINIKGALDLPTEMLYETRLTGIEESKIKDFLAIFKVDTPQSLHSEIYNETNGYIFYLKFLAVAQKALGLPVSILLKEHSSSGLPLELFLAKKLIGKLSASARKILLYLALFRHEITANILKTIDHFDNLQEDLETLKSFLLLEDNGGFELRDFLNEMIIKNISDREKQKIHEKIANFYAEQIPLKPNERVIELSRTTLYSEKFYHYNIFTKLSKNFELQNSRKVDYANTDDTKLNSEKIKYIASTKYLPDLDIKPDEEIKPDLSYIKEKEEKIQKETELVGDLFLSEEEKALLGETSDDDIQEYDEISSPEPPKDYSFDDTFSEIPQEMPQTEDDELASGKSLLQKGLGLFNEGNTIECMGYLKNAMVILQDIDKEAYCSAKLTLAKAQIENFRNFEAKEHLQELLNQNISPSANVDALIELASIDDYENNRTIALHKLTDALRIAEQNKIKTHSAKVYFRTALIYDDMNNTEKALYNYLLAATDATDVNDKAIMASCYSNIAAIYQEQNDLPKAVEYHKKSLKEDELANNYEGQAKTLASLGSIFLSKNKATQAIKIFIRETQIAKKTGDKYLIASSYLELGDTFLSIQDYKNALKAYFLSKKNIDSTISTDSKNKIERRFEMIVDEIGESAYNFLVKELRKQ